MKEELIKKYRRLPPLTGIPFVGFDFARIESRTPVEKRMREFLKICKEGKFLNVAIVRAEWGEGKTDAFERYIKPETQKEGHYAYLVSTSTIINRIKSSPNLQSYPSSVALLMSVLCALKDELSASGEDESLFVDYTEYRNPNEYINAVLEEHLEANNKKIIIFVDEFEEILAHGSEISKSIFSGIKELINGQLRIIHEGGKYEGRLHIVIACTPYAYNKIKEDVELAQILGAFVSRVSHIELPPIKKKEAFNFLVDLLKYSFGKIPIPLPFKSSGIFYTISTMSQRNLRALIQLYVSLMTDASLNGKMKIIDYNDVLDTFRGKEITIYGGPTECIDNGLLQKIENDLKKRSDECLKLFRLLAGELRPFSTDEIKNRLRLNSDVHSLVEIINQEIQKIGVSEGIVRLCPIKKKCAVKNIINKLKPTENQIRVGNSKISIEDFENQTTFSELKNGTIFSITAFPKDPSYLENIFNLSAKEAKDLHRQAINFFDEIARKRYFTISQELINQLFPSPTWALIDFVTDRAKRMELWREVVRDFAKYKEEARDGAVELINRSDKIKITEYIDYPICKLRYTLTPGKTAEIITYIYPVIGSVGKSEFEKIKTIVRTKKVRLVLLIFTGEIEEDIREEVRAQSIILPVYIKPIRVQQLLTAILARNRGYEIVDTSLENRFKEINYELGLDKTFDKWIELRKSEGSIIDDLRKFFGESDKFITDILTFHLNFLGEELTSNEIFSKSQDLRKFTLFGQKGVLFAPIDIETAGTFEKYQTSLVSNGFLKIKNGKATVQSTPIEKRILQILARKKFRLNDLKRQFIIFAHSKNILEQAYLPILERKGLIEKIDDEITLVEKQKEKKRLDNEFKIFQDYFDKDRLWWSYAHIAISKERDTNVILLKDFYRYMGDLYEKLKTVHIREEVYLQKVRFIRLLIEHFDKRLKPLVNQAWIKARGILTEDRKRIDEISNKIKSILIEYNKRSEKAYTVDLIEDYKELSRLYEEMQGINKRNYDRETLEREVNERLRDFSFRKDDEDALFFNIKLADLAHQNEIFERQLQKMNENVNLILGLIERCKRISGEIRLGIVGYKIEEKYKASRAICAKLESYSQKIVEPRAIARPSLQDIKGFFDVMAEELSKYDGQIRSYLTDLERSLEIEKEIVERKKLREKICGMKDFFDRDTEKTEKISEFLVKFTTAEEKYSKIVNEAEELEKSELKLASFGAKTSKLINDMDETSTSLKGVETNLSELIIESLNEIENYKKNVINFFKILKKAKMDISSLEAPFTVLMNRQKEKIEALDLGEFIKRGWEAIWSEIYAFRDKIYEKTKKYLTEEEFEILFATAQLIKRKKWVDISTVVSEAKKRVKKSDEELIEVIKKLADKKLLKFGVYLPI